PNAILFRAETGAEELDLEAAGPRLRSVEECPSCELDVGGNWEPFTSTAALVLSILAETTLAELPEYPGTDNIWLPAHGRRLLAFSDTRQEAARLGPRLTRQHETQLFRAALLQCFQNTPLVDESLIQLLQQERDELRAKLDNPALPLTQRQYYQGKL